MADNKSLVTRFLTEVICEGDPTAFDELVSPDFVDLHGRTGADAALLREAISRQRELMERQEFVPVHVAADGDLVFVLADYHARPRAGGQINARLMLFYRFHDGRIVENMVAAATS